MIYKGIWMGCSGQTDWSYWKSTLASRINETGAKAVLSAIQGDGNTSAREEKIYDWLGSNSPGWLLVPRNRSSKKDNWNWRKVEEYVERTEPWEDLKPWVEECVSYFSDLSRVSAYIIWHENYSNRYDDWDINNPSPHLEDVIEYFRTNWPGKDIILVGNLNEKWKGDEPPYKVVPDEVRKKAWKYDDCVWVHDCYHWINRDNRRYEVA